MRGHLNVVVAEEGHKGFVSWPNFFFFVYIEGWTTSVLDFLFAPFSWNCA